MSQKRSGSPDIQWLLSIFAGILLTCCGLFFSAFLMVSQDLSQNFLSPLATLSVCLGCCGGAWLLAYKRRQNGLMCGVFIGSVFAAALLSWSFVNGGSPLETTVLLRLCLIMVVSCFSGYAGMLSAEKKRRHR